MPDLSPVCDLPPHLARFRVDQEPEAYTPRDHAVWRHILRRLTAQLKDTAHPSYLPGLAAAGIGLDRIPDLKVMDQALGRLGWRAMGVRGFIPPAVFTELQAQRVLAIACDIRSHQHLGYTPAPDIIHESAGHAPFLVDARYADYLQACGEVGFRAIATVEDQAVFEAIRNLSVVKEDPEATAEEQAHAEARLTAAVAGRRHVSESTRASRLYWWTAEYGLVGSLDAPRIYGAGLLSSLDESALALGPTVRRLPLTVDCADMEFDITRMQPQLYVARDFEHLFEVLDQFREGLAWRRGGDFGLQEAWRSRAVNHLVMADGLELTGQVSELWEGEEALPLKTRLVRISGPFMRSRKGKALGAPHPGSALVVLGEGSLPDRGPFRFEGPGGLRMEGFRVGDGETLDFKASLEGRPLELPTWLHLFVTSAIPSVAGGPADPALWDRSFGELGAFTAGDGERRAQAHKAASLPADLAEAYAAQARLETGQGQPGDEALVLESLARHPQEDLLRMAHEERSVR